MYFPHLPAGIKRIIPWLGQGGLRDLGFELHLVKDGGWLVDTRNGESHDVKYNTEIELPVYEGDFVNSLAFVASQGISCDRSSTVMFDVEQELDQEQKLKEAHAGGRVFVTKQMTHLRQCHWGPSFGLCPCCDLSKGQRGSHDKVRCTPVESYRPLKTIAWDFASALPRSIRGFRTMLIGICDSIAKTFVRPLVEKGEVVDEIEEVIHEVRQDFSTTESEKVCQFLRRDNEPVIGSKAMQSMMRRQGVSDCPIVPHNSEQNGTCERWVRSLSDAMRATMNGVSSDLWCYASQYCSAIWDRLPRNFPKLPHYSGKSPLQVLDERTGRCSSKVGLDMARRFGCLCYFRVQGHKERRLEPKWIRAVFLGFDPKTAGWLVGTYRPNNTTRDGYKWTTYSSLDVKFREDILVSDSKFLLPTSNGIFVKWDRLDDLQRGVSSSGFPADGQATNLDHGLGSSETSHVSGPPADFPDLVEHRNSAPFLAEGPPSQGGSPQQPLLLPSETESGANTSARERSSSVDQKRPDPARGSQPVAGKRRRGRPPGAPDKKPRVRRTKAELARDLALFASVVGGCDFEPGEEVIEAHVMLSVAAALKGPRSLEWSAAISKEHARLCLYDTWRPATDGECASASQILPICIVLTEKRDKSLKARACCLGNLDKDGNVLTYASVVSSGANRLLLTAAISEGEHVIAYDLDSAFLNAQLDRDVFCRLPPIWAKSHPSSVVKLQKALYGLRDSPRLWEKEYHRILRSLNWEPCPSAPGLWRKPSIHGGWLKKSVYVDDNLIAGKVRSEIESELALILEHVKGRQIPETRYKDSLGRDWILIDILGSDVHLCREHRLMRISMSSYLTKLQQKHKVEIGKSVYSPTFDESALQSEDSKTVPDFPYRTLVGAMQWVCSQARPDAQVPVATLARYVAKTPTAPMVRACLKVLKFLICSKDQGITYSPEGESEFRTLYGSLLPEGRDLPEACWFSDASFASCLQTFRSTSGSICYWRSVPICWRSSRQTVRAYSTAESEFIAASDCIMLSEHNNFMDFYSTPPSCGVEPKNGLVPSLDDSVLFVDNTSAIATATSADTKPKSRHYALRYFRVRDAGGEGKLCFCPTTLMKADGLTKLSCSSEQRGLLLHHVAQPIEDCEDSEDDDPCTGTAFLSIGLVHSIYSGF